MSQTEPWLSGTLQNVNPFIAPLLYSLQMAREDLARFTDGLSTEQIWARHGDVNPVGREVRHIAGSVERLVTYLEGKQLTETQMEAMKRENEPGAGREHLLAGCEEAFAYAERTARGLDPARLTEPRYVGRRRLPTTVIGLLVHIAEHTQRHVGSAIVAAKLARAAGAS